MTFKQALKLQSELYSITDELSNKLNSFDKNELGMISYSNNESKEVKNALRIKFRELQKVNKMLTSEFKKEYKMHRLELRRSRWNN